MIFFFVYLNNQFCRSYEQLYSLLAGSGLIQLVSLTRCRKPCTYKKYSLVGNPQPSTFVLGQNFIFGLRAPSNMTMVEKEQLIYPLTSLVAEFGGTLGLFLGFSFMAIWDKVLFMERISWNSHKKTALKKLTVC